MGKWVEYCEGLRKYHLHITSMLPLPALSPNRFPTLPIRVGAALQTLHTPHTCMILYIRSSGPGAWEYAVKIRDRIMHDCLPRRIAVAYV
jgi:hypothetical protein